jgi:GH24 family phage-related lysozyme (muramidase)
MGGILPFAIQLLEALPGLFASGAQALALIQAHTDALKAMVAENRGPTQDEWNALNATISGFEAQLDAPLATAATVDSVKPPSVSAPTVEAAQHAPESTPTVEAAQHAPESTPTVEAAQHAPESVTAEAPLGGQLSGGSTVIVPMTRTLSAAGEALIKSFEGCSLTAYRDGAGVPTIGFGHTLGVAMGLTITPEQAEAFFLSDTASIVAAVNACVNTCTQNQFDALVDFAYNCGVQNLKDSTLLHLHNAGDYAGAAGQFGLWVHANGEVLAGLVTRRAAEARLYATP